MVFYLFGPDTYRSKQKLIELKNKFLTEVDQSGMNLDILDGQSLAPHVFRQNVFASPFLSKRRMVIITNLLGHKLVAGTEITILNYLDREEENPCDALLIFYQDENVDSKQGKLTKQLETALTKSDYVQEFKALTGTELTKWVREESKKRGEKALPKKYVDRLIKVACGDLWQMSNKLNQLIAYLSNNAEGQAEESELDNLIGCATDNTTIWNLIETSLTKDRALFFRLVEEQATQANYALFLKECSRRIKLILLIQSCMADNLGTYDLASTFSYPPFIVQKSMSYAQKFNKQEMLDTHNRLLQIDRCKKKYSTDPKLPLNLYMFDPAETL
jgi:DNA polymerase III delta subunit